MNIKQSYIKTDIKLVNFSFNNEELMTIQLDINCHSQYFVHPVITENIFRWFISIVIICVAKISLNII